MRPGDTDFPQYFGKYISLVPESDVLKVLEEQLPLVEGLKKRVNATQELFAYAPDKWTVRQAFGHVVDAERVFGFRAFCFSRADSNPLPSFDQDDYVTRGAFNDTSLAELIDDFVLVRQANLRVLRRLGPAEWAQVGTASKGPISVRALAFVMAGHVRHHVGILKDRYGIQGVA